MNQVVNGIHIPSFALGFGSCVLLYYLKPGLISIFGGLISFLKVFAIFVIITAGIVFAIKSQPQQQDKNVNEQDGKFNTVPGRIGTIKSKEANIEDGEFKYFPIPVTKFEDDQQRQLHKSRFGESSIQSIQSNESMTESTTDYYTEKPSTNSKDYYVEDPNKYDKTLRYENFVKMASKR